MKEIKIENCTVYIFNNEDEKETSVKTTKKKTKPKKRVRKKIGFTTNT